MTFNLAAVTKPSEVLLVIDRIAPAASLILRSMGALLLVTLTAASAYSVHAHADTYQYDALNRLVRVEYAGGKAIRYSYDAAGNRTRVVLGPITLATTTIIDTHTPNPSLVGAPIAVTAHVTVTPPGSGTPTGTITISDGSANCLITLTASGCNLTPTSAGPKMLVATYGGDAAFSDSISAGVGHTVAAGSLDVDGSITLTKYDALTDGLLTIRYLFGLTGPSLTNGALGPTASRTDPVAVKAYLDGIRPALDVDGNGAPDALTDGLLIIRYLFGLRGNSLIAGAIDPSATRTTTDAIEAYLQTLLP